MQVKSAGLQYWHAKIALGTLITQVQSHRPACALRLVPGNPNKRVRAAAVGLRSTRHQRTGGVADCCAWSFPEYPSSDQALGAIAFCRGMRSRDDAINRAISDFRRVKSQRFLGPNRLTNFARYAVKTHPMPEKSGRHGPPYGGNLATSIGIKPSTSPRESPASRRLHRPTPVQNAVHHNLSALAVG
jgi:hypothetical protein